MEHQANRYLGARAVGDTSRRACIGTQASPWNVALFQALTLALLLCVAGTGQAQVLGEEAELDRLRTKAEEAMGNDDAEGAAMSMGRAALMAAQLAKRQTEAAPRRTFKTTEHLYRSQEHGYRAVALFRRAGGELPASAGVCGSLQLAHLELQHAQDALAETPPTDRPDSASPRLTAIRQTTDDWAIVLASMMGEFHCPD